MEFKEKFKRIRPNNDPGGTPEIIAWNFLCVLFTRAQSLQYFRYQ